MDSARHETASRTPARGISAGPVVNLSEAVVLEQAGVFLLEISASRD